jgi:hypothetical protein
LVFEDKLSQTFAELMKLIVDGLEAAPALQASFNTFVETVSTK